MRPDRGTLGLEHRAASRGAGAVPGPRPDAVPGPDAAVFRRRPPPAEAREAAFARALLDPGAPPPPGLRASRRPGDDAPLARRFAVYRNTVVVGLVDALAARFPVTERLLGRDFFRAAARAFALAHPPQSPVLLHYGDDLPAFLAAFPPAAPAAFAAEVARLEAAVARAAHAADAEPLGAEALAGLAPEALAGARLGLHPSLEVVASSVPVVSIHEREAMGHAGPPPYLRRGEDALVLRPRLEVQIRRLPPGGARFVAALAGGTPLGEAATRGAEAPGFDLAANLAGLFAVGAIATAQGGS